MDPPPFPAEIVYFQTTWYYIVPTWRQSSRLMGRSLSDGQLAKTRGPVSVHHQKHSRRAFCQSIPQPLPRASETRRRPHSSPVEARNFRHPPPSFPHRCPCLISVSLFKPRQSPLPPPPPFLISCEKETECAANFHEKIHLLTDRLQDAKRFFLLF